MPNRSGCANRAPKVIQLNHLAHLRPLGLADRVRVPVSPPHPSQHGQAVVSRSFGTGGMDENPTTIHTCGMAARDAVSDRPEWFIDSRGESRRMRMTWHSEDGLVVLSLWQGSGCTGTFRMPVQDAARLISILADSLADAARPPAPPGPPPKRWADAFRGWFRRRPSATILPLRIVGRQ